MSLGKPIREAQPEPDEWVHEPTPKAPYLYRNKRTGMFANRSPVPAPKYTNLPYLGPHGIVPNTGTVVPDPEVTEVDIACYEALLDPEFNGLYELL